MTDMSDDNDNGNIDYIIDDLETSEIRNNQHPIEISIIDQNKDSYPMSLLESAISNKIDLESKDEHFDVIIIGGGLAGLSAGYNLKKADKNLNILIVEAKNRVGGRTQTLKLNCSKEGELKEWDVGGQWV
jgi:heterodisulfide reductase subunit A-like polyferredoxin